MKVSEFLTKILPATSFPDASFQNDLTTALAASGLKDVEVPDETITKFNAVYMTTDRAKNDPEIARAYRAKHFGQFADESERDLKHIIALLPEATQDKYYAIPQDKPNGIKDRLAILKDGVADVVTKGVGEDGKAAIEKERKIQKELRDQLVQRDKTIEDTKEQSAQRENAIKIDYALRGKLVDKFPTLDPNLFNTQAKKDFLIKETIDSLRSNYLLEFDKDNQTVINLLNKEGGPAYEGNNTQVTLDKFIEKSLEPYVVKNNGGTPPSNPAAKKEPIVIDKSKTTSGRGSLVDIRIADARKAGVIA